MTCFTHDFKPRMALHALQLLDKIAPAIPIMHDQCDDYGIILQF